MAMRNIGPEEMPRCADLVHTVLSAVQPIDDRQYELDPEVLKSVRAGVRELCGRFPIPRYPRIGA